MACTPGFIAAEGLWAPLLLGVSTRRCRGPLLLPLLTGTFRSAFVPVWVGGATRPSGASLSGGQIAEGRRPYRAAL